MAGKRKFGKENKEDRGAADAVVASPGSGLFFSAATREQVLAAGMVTSVQDSDR